MNSADAATLTASSGSGVANLQTDDKTATWQSVGTSATLTATWTDPQIVGGAVIGYCNLTALATVTLRAYLNASDVVPAVEVTVSETPGALDALLWGVDPLAMTWADDSGTPQHRQAWLPVAAVCRKLEVVIDDPNNPDGFIRASRLSAGDAWEMTYNPAYGATVRIVDGAKTSRTESLALRLEPIGTYRAVDLDFAYMAQDDAAFWSRVANRGRAPLFVSVQPGEVDHRQQAGALFCVPSNNIEQQQGFFNAWAQRLTLEEL